MCKEKEQIENRNYRNERQTETAAAAETQTKTLSVTCWIIFAIFKRGRKPRGRARVRAGGESCQWPSASTSAVAPVVSPSIR